MRSPLSQLTVNWHFTDCCNMRCAYCFANKSGLSSCTYEVLLHHCRAFKRVNFVGGEPTLSPLFPQMAAYAQSLGLETSVVTNGLCALQNPSLFEVFRPMVTVGLSIDSLSRESNFKIGRHHRGRTLSQEDALSFCKRIKQMGAELKINTVVNSVNLSEDFSHFLDQARPSRWKLFQVLTKHSPQAEVFRISDEEFKGFIEHHKAWAHLMQPESSSLMSDSYVMLNAEGYFMETAPYEVRPSQKSLLQKDTNVLEEFQKMNYDLQKYAARYKNNEWKK